MAKALKPHRETPPSREEVMSELSQLMPLVTKPDEQYAWSSLIEFFHGGWFLSSDSGRYRGHLEKSLQTIRALPADSQFRIKVLPAVLGLLEKIEFDDVRYPSVIDGMSGPSLNEQLTKMARPGGSEGKGA